MDIVGALRVSLGLTIAAYLGFNFIAMYLSLLPTFLYIENFFWALAYFIALYSSFRGFLWPSLLVSSFNAGRVSDAIITSGGSLHALALEHTPLFALLILVMALSAASMVRRCG
ncbi:MAG: hypothetical protein P3X22_000385 [Thermoprotei archaeon]|nr:hypothetical protein [Thermoprotei archaeon]